MKKVLICVLIFSLFILSGCSNSELENLEIDIKEQNLKTETIYSSYKLSKNSAEELSEVFVIDLLNFDDTSIIEYSDFDSLVSDIDLKVNSYLYRARILNYAKKYIDNYDKVKIVDGEYIDNSITLEEVKNFVNENVSQYFFLDSESGVLKHIVYIYFPNNVLFELTSEWYEGILNNMNLTQVGD